jgi:2,3-dihydroxyphenylpropionate 1,2-dioxygenase
LPEEVIMPETMLLCASHSPLLFCFTRPPERWQELQDTFAAKAEAVAAFDPQLVIAFGSDHFNGFFMKNMPRFCVGLRAEATADIGGFPGPLSVPGEEAAALHLYLAGAGFDAAVSHRMIVDHAFSQTIHLMLGGLARRPVVPIFINCINEPFIPFTRTRLFGTAVGRFAAASGKRVLLLASGGMSHHPTRYYPPLGDPQDPVTAWQISGGEAPASLSRDQWLQRLDTMHHEGAAMIARGERTATQMHLNEEVDQRFLEPFLRGELEAYDGWDQHQLVKAGGIGIMELQTWLAAAAAHRACGGTPPQLDFYGVTLELGIAAGVVSSRVR